MLNCSAAERAVGSCTSATATTCTSAAIVAYRVRCCRAICPAPMKPTRIRSLMARYHLACKAYHPEVLRGISECRCVVTPRSLGVPRDDIVAMFHRALSDGPPDQRDRLPRAFHLVPVRWRALDAPGAGVARVEQQPDRFLRRRDADLVAGVVP